MGSYLEEATTERPPRQRKVERQRKRRRITRWESISALLRFYVVYYVFYTLAAGSGLGQGVALQDGTSTVGYQEPAADACGIARSDEGGPDYVHTAGPKTAEQQEEAGSKDRSPQEGTSQKDGTMGKFQEEHARTLAGRTCKIRKRTTRAVTGHRGDSDQPGQSNAWRDDHHGTGTHGRGRGRVRSMVDRHGRQATHGTSQGQGQGDQCADGCGIETCSRRATRTGQTYARDANADDIHGSDNHSPQSGFTNQDTTRPCVDWDPRLRVQEETPCSGTLRPRCSDACENAGNGEGQRYQDQRGSSSAAHTRSRKDGWRWNTKVADVWYNKTGANGTWGEAPMDAWDRTGLDQTQLQRGHHEGYRYSPEDAYYQEADDFKYQDADYGVGGHHGQQHVSQRPKDRMPTAQLHQVDAGDHICEDRMAPMFHGMHFAIPKDEDDDPMMIQIHTTIISLMMKKVHSSLDEDVLDDFQARQALEEQAQIERRRRQDWMLMPQRCGLMPPWVSRHAHFYRSTYPENYRPPSRRFHIPADAEAFNTVRSIDRIWTDIPRTQRPEHHWWAYRLHPASRESYNLDVDVTNYILLTRQDMTSFLLHPVVMLEIQRQHRGRFLVQTFARRIGKHQTRETLIRDIGFMMACGITHQCHTWVNGRYLDHEPLTIEIADYILMDMTDIPVRPVMETDTNVLHIPRQRPTVMTENPTMYQEQLANQLAQIPSTLRNEELCVLHRPDQGHEGPRTIAYVGIVVDNTIFSLIRNKWPDLIGQRIQVKDVHESFYADFQHDPTQVTLIVLLHRFHMEGATMCGILMFLRIDGFQGLQCVPLSRETSAMGLLFWAGILDRCHVTRTHECQVSHNGQTKEGSTRIYLDNADYVRISAKPRGQRGLCADFVKISEDGQLYVEEAIQLWPAATMRAGPRHTVTVRPVPKRAARLHEAYWITMAGFAWISTMLLLRLQVAREQRPKKRRRSKPMYVKPKTTLFLLGLLCCHQVQPVATLMIQIPPTTYTQTQEEMTLNLPIRKVFHDPWLGLPPPGNPHADNGIGAFGHAIQITTQGISMLDKINDYLEYRLRAHNLWTILKRIPTPTRSSRSTPVVVSLQTLLYPTQDRCTPCVETEGLPIAQGTETLPKSKLGDPQAPLGDRDKQKVDLGGDVFHEDDGLLVQWPPLMERSPHVFLKDLPAEFATIFKKPKITDLSQYDYIHVYTDGSAGWYDGDKRSSWAFVICAAHTSTPTDDQLTYYDWFGHITQDDPLGTTWLGALQQSSRSGEGEAIAWAILWLLQHGPSQQVYIHSDATSVLQAAIGQWSFAKDDHLLLRVRALYQLLWTLMERDTLNLQYIPAHAGHFGNEIADLLAKAICALEEPHRLPEVNIAKWMHGTPPLIEWAWTMVDPLHRAGQVPTFTREALHWEHWQPPSEHLDWLPSIPQRTDTPQQTTHLQFTMASYNVGSLKEPAKAAYLRQQMQFYNIAVASLQETRASFDDVPDSNYYRFIAKSDKGIGGCELWVSATIPYTQKDEEGLCFRRQQFQVIHAEPQLLIIACDLHEQKLLFVVGHAPHQGHGMEQVSTWWTSLTHYLERHSNGRNILVCIDANARPEKMQPHVGPLGEHEGGPTGAAFTTFLQRHDLFLPSTFTEHHEGPSHTWCSNDAQKTARIDFIAIPLAWRHLALHSRVNHSLDSGIAGLDHKAVTLHIQGIWGKPEPDRHRIRFDRDKISQATPEIWKHFFDNWPSIPWTVDPSTHAAIIEQELQRRLVQFFPATGKKKRNSLRFTDSTWQLFAQRNAHRRVLSAHKQAQEGLLRHCAYQAWRNDRQYHPINVENLKYILRTSMVWKRHKRDNQLIKAALSQERAQHLKALGATLDSACRADIMQRLKPFRLGQRKRDLGKRPLPMVNLENGEIAQDPQQAISRWRRHYAQMEGGTVISRQDLLAEAAQPRHAVPFDIHEMPSLFELERQLRASKPYRAMGPDNVPGELLHFAPQQIAQAVWPLYIKQVLTLSEAVQFKGGRLISAYKRRGDIRDCSNHRALLVSSSLGKAFHNTFRQRTMRYIHAASGPMQVTSHQHPSVLLPAHAVRAHINQAKRTNVSAFCLFLDISQAFYRIIRQFACHSDCSDEHVVQFLRRMQIEDFCVDDIAELLEKGPSLSHYGCPNFLHSHVSSLHSSTWFVLANDSEAVKTERGTRPGDGFADAIWSLVFAKWIQRMEDRLQSTGAFPPLLWNQEIGIKTSTGPVEVQHALIAWADDVAILGRDEDPQVLIDKLRFACQTMVEELLTYGLIPNFKEGKTEAVVDPRGKGSTQLRRKIFTEGQNMLSIKTDLPDQPSLRLVPRYKHLGGLITHGAKMRPEIASRAAQATHAASIYRTKVYQNRLIDLPTRYLVLQTTSLATLHYGAGTWSRLTAQELKLWTTTHFSLYRKIFAKLYHHERIRHMSDDEVLSRLQEVHPHITLRLLRLAWYGNMLPRECPTFWALMAYEKWWIQQIHEDLHWLHQQLVGFTWLPPPDDDIDAWHLFAIQSPMRWKKILKRARLHAAWQHTVHYNVTRYHARATAFLHEAGAPIPLQEQLEVQRAHYCFACKKNFPTFRGWAVHSFRKHQRINKWRRLQQGNVCLACAKQFPSEARLIRHLKSVKSCADTVASQRLWVEPKPAFGSKMITQQEKQLLLDTWDYTDMPQLPTIPGWTMTIQTKNFLQYCTTVVWLSEDAEQRCFEQMAMYAVCEEELREIQEAL